MSTQLVSNARSMEASNLREDHLAVLMVSSGMGFSPKSILKFLGLKKGCILRGVSLSQFRGKWAFFIGFGPLTCQTVTLDMCTS